MKQGVFLDKYDVQRLVDILNYVVSNDDVEREDFIENHDPEKSLFDENDDLILGMVTGPARNHIYWLCERMFEDLAKSGALS